MRRMGILTAPDDLLILDLCSTDRLTQRLARHGQAIQMQLPCTTLDFVQDGRNATGTVNIVHVPLPRGGYLADVRDACGNRVDAFQRVIEAGFIGQRNGMQDRIGRAAHGHIEGKSIVERFGSDDVSGSDIFVE